MENYATNWTKNEFLTYLFIYCMNADFKEVKKELTYIEAKTSNAVFNRMHDEFEEDSDYASLQKIMNTHDKLGFSKDDTEELFDNLKELFLSDYKYDIQERNLLKGLKHLLK